MNNVGNHAALITRVSLISMVGNIALTAIKLIVGIAAHSGAMISDAVHSLSDVLGSAIVIVGAKVSGRAPDNDHPYGHERFECVAAILLGVLLAITGAALGISAVKTVLSGEYSAIPGPLLIGAALLSIIGKEAMFQYTMGVAKRINSVALKAEAWHHRSDALSSVGALIGIVGAALGAPVMEPIAGAVISVFILNTAVKVFIDAINRMVDHAADDELQSAIRDCALEQRGVLGVDALRTRVFGSGIYVDMEISADGSQSLDSAHEIAEQVHSAVERRFDQVRHIMVHVNPAKLPKSKA